MQNKYVFDFSEGAMEQLDLLGGKGANLAEMTRLGLPVPPGFTITTEACREYLASGDTPPTLRFEVTRALRRLEETVGRRLGDVSDPLLISVRSGAKFSMPGMMDTVLDIGLNDLSVRALADAWGDERFAWDSYRRLIQMFGKTVLGIDGSVFADTLDSTKAQNDVARELDLAGEELQKLVEQFKALVRRHTGREFPQDPREQFDMAICAVFDSWNSSRARLYRRRERIPDQLGTAVNVCTMVFGNLGTDSGTGGCFSRDPASGRPGIYGDYLPNAQGEDVVAGVRNPLTLEEFSRADAVSFAELRRAIRRLETHYRDLCDIEFTVERGKLWLLQTRVGKRTPAAAFRTATQLVDEGLITLDEALQRVNGLQLAQLTFPQFDPRTDRVPLVRGIAASPGAAVGKAVFDPATAVAWAASGVQAILVRRETSPEDLEGMVAAVGLLTSRGGRTSHAAVVARGMGRPCVSGAQALEIDPRARVAYAGLMQVQEGDLISLDGSTGEVFAGAVPVGPSPVLRYLENGLDATLTELGADEDGSDLVRAVDRMLRHADAVRRLGVRANADSAFDAKRARRLGAQGIGLCRTEHQFLGDRRGLIERLVLASTAAEREAALESLRPLQRADFTGLLEAMDGLPVTVRLLDPPLHEFLPDRAELMARVARADERGETVEGDVRLLAAVNRLSESNPMLGLRGVRLGLVVPGLFALQMRALAEAVADRVKAGGSPQAEIMVPLVGSVMELQLVRDQADAILADVADTRGVPLSIPIGTMVELPRAALTAFRIAEVAEFFSFGTNDLTQTTWGFSRDDVEAAFFAAYLSMGVFTVSPFETLDVDGVRRLVRMAADEGRQTRPGLHLGVCGDQGGDPESIHFFDQIGLDYVSCSPFRVPVARLEAGRATLLGRTPETRNVRVAADA